MPQARIDPALQQSFPSSQLLQPAVNFEGVNNGDGVLPPDVNGDVGPSHYVQWVNLSFAIYQKDGTRLYGPARGSTLFSGFGGPCETSNDGDPIVLYDELAGRWLMSQFALPNYPNGPFYQCIAISTTGNPAGSSYRYAFKVSATKLNDYPTFGVCTRPSVTRAAFILIARLRSQPLRFSRRIRMTTTRKRKRFYCRGNTR